MALVYLTRSVGFRAVHRYFRPDWPEERNARVFGDCALAPGHSHDYRCVVTVKGLPDQETGMIVDLALLDGLLRELVTDRFDGRHVNHDLPEYAFGRTVPTGEMLCLDIWRRLSVRLPPGCALHAVRVQESDTLWAEYRGEG